MEGRFGLTINREKTKVVRLGHSLEKVWIFSDSHCDMNAALRHSDRYLHVGPSYKAMERVRMKLRELTSSRICFKPAPLMSLKSIVCSEAGANTLAMVIPAVPLQR